MTCIKKTYHKSMTGTSTSTSLLNSYKTPHIRIYMYKFQTFSSNVRKKKFATKKKHKSFLYAFLFGLHIHIIITVNCIKYLKKKRKIILCHAHCSYLFVYVHHSFYHIIFFLFWSCVCFLWN